MIEKFSPFLVRDIDSTLATVQSTEFATSEEELQAAIDLQNSEAEKPDIDFDSRFDFEFGSETHPHHLVVAARGMCCQNDIDFLQSTGMAQHIKMDTYSGELGIRRQKIIDDCHAQWTEYQQGKREGKNQMLFIKQLSTMMGGEAQGVWRRFVKRDEELVEGEPRSEQRQFEREARKIWKKYKRIMW